MLTIAINGDSVDCKETDNARAHHLQARRDAHQDRWNANHDCKLDGPTTLKVTYSDGDTVGRSNTFVLSSKRQDHPGNRRHPGAVSLDPKKANPAAQIQIVIPTEMEGSAVLIPTSQPDRDG